MSSLKNSILTRYDGGFRTDNNTSSISANGLRETFLSLGNVRSSANSDQIVQSYLSSFGSGVTTVTAAIQPTDASSTPYVGMWGVGASISVPRPSNSGTLEVMQVRSLTVSDDDTGIVSFAPELVRSAETRVTLVENELQRLGNGTLNGRANSATIATDIDPDVKAGRVSTTEQQFSKDTLAVELSPVFNPSDYYRIESLFCSLKTRGTTATTLQLLVNGVAQEFKMTGSAASTTVTIPANTWAIYGYITSFRLLAPTDSVQMSITAAGTSAVGVNARLVLGAR